MQGTTGWLQYGMMVLIILVIIVSTMMSSYASTAASIAADTTLMELAEQVLDSTAYVST
jgi:hypothetical protein